MLLPIALALLLPRQTPSSSSLRLEVRDDWSPVDDERDVPPEPLPPLRPESWLVAPAFEGGALSPVAFFARYLTPDSAAPRRGDRVVGSDAEQHWEERGLEEGAVNGAQCAYTVIELEESRICMARLTGAGALFVNGAGFVGDPERRGFRGVPVALRAGVNHLFVMEARGAFELELWSPRTRMVIGTWDLSAPVLPRELEAWTFRYLSYPVFNVSADPVDDLHVHHGHAAPDDGRSEPSAIESWEDGCPVAPLGLRSTGNCFGGGESTVTSAPTASGLIEVYAEGDRWSATALVRVPVVPDAELAAKTMLHPGREHAAPPLHKLNERLAHGPLLIYPSAGDDAENAVGLERARFDQERLWYSGSAKPYLYRDREILAAIQDPKTGGWVGSYDVVLYGNVDTNVAWNTFVPKDAPLQARRGELSLGGSVIEGESLIGWALSSRADAAPLDRRVLVVADTDPRAARAGYLIHPLEVFAAGADSAVFSAAGWETGVLPRVDQSAVRDR